MKFGSLIATFTIGYRIHTHSITHMISESTYLFKTHSAESIFAPEEYSTNNKGAQLRQDRDERLPAWLMICLWCGTIKVEEAQQHRPTPHDNKECFTVQKHTHTGHSDCLGLC